MDIAKAAEDNDIIIEQDGLQVFLAKEANNLFPDATIDFLDEQGFVITGMSQSSCC
jgi:Fe-S cluster assembly iron-binding protein IscA